MEVLDSVCVCVLRTLLLGFRAKAPGILSYTAL